MDISMGYLGMYAVRKELSEATNSRHSMQLYQEQMHKGCAEHHSRARKIHTYTVYRPILDSYKIQYLKQQTDKKITWL